MYARNSLIYARGVDRRKRFGVLAFTCCSPHRRSIQNRLRNEGTSFEPINFTFSLTWKQHASLNISTGNFIMELNFLIQRNHMHWLMMVRQSARFVTCKLTMIRMESYSSRHHRISLWPFRKPSERFNHHPTYNSYWSTGYCPQTTNCYPTSHRSYCVPCCIIGPFLHYGQVQYSGDPRRWYRSQASCTATRIHNRVEAENRSIFGKLYP